MLNNKKLQLIQEATAAFPGTPVNSAIWYYLKDRFTGITVAELISKYLRDIRWAYNFDGVDDRATLQFRAINPDGDIDIEFRTGPVVPAAGGQDYAVISQCFSANYTLKEFTMYFNSSPGSLQCLLGGNFFSSSIATVLGPNKTYRWLLQGNTQTFWVNGVQVFTGSVTRGTGREPSAATVIGAQTHGGANTFRAFASGFFYDVRINGVLWPMADRNQAIQLPSPSGLGPEQLPTPLFVSAVSPGVVGNNGVITFVDVGSWGGCNLPAQAGLLAGVQYLIEFDVQLSQGRWGVRLGMGGAAGELFEGSNSGRIRLIATANLSNTGIQLFSRQASTSAVFSNFSLRPLWVASATELVTNGDFAGGAAGWTPLDCTLNASSGQAVITTTQGNNSRVERGVNLEQGATYLVTADLVGLSGNTEARVRLQRGAAGNYASIGTQVLTSVGKFSFVVIAPATDSIISLRGDGSSAGTVTYDNVSVRKLDSLCKPMVTSNFNSDRWQEVQP